MGHAPCILGYYPDWSSDPAHIDFSLYTHVAHAFAEVPQSGAPRYPGDAARTLVAAAHAAKARVILSVGGADSNAALARQPTDALADALAKRVHDFRYDGIDVDWEAPGNDDEGCRLSALVRALRKRLPRHLLTLAVPAGDWSGRWFSRPTSCRRSTGSNAMTYDFCGPWCDTVLHNAPMGQVVLAALYWRGRGWPAKKILLGIPAYGRRMRAVRFGDPAPAGTYVESDIRYRDIPQLLAQGWIVQDPQEEVPYLVKPGGGELITYEDEASAHRKGRIARICDLHGFFFWDINEDFHGTTNLLARGGAAGLGGSRWCDRAPGARRTNPS